jgi:hypothetical protein
MVAKTNNIIKNNTASLLEFKLIITKLFSYGSGLTTESTATKMQAKCRQFRLLCRCGGTMRGTSPDTAHPRLHWMSPSGECLHGIAAAAAMANEFGQQKNH